MFTIEKAIASIESTAGPFVAVEGDFSLHDLVKKLHESGFHVVEIDRAPVYSKEALMHALYQHLRFPGYFGFTWDSLKDVFISIDGSRPSGFVLIFNNFGLLSEDDRQEFLKVVAEANLVRAQYEGLEKLIVVALPPNREPIHSFLTDDQNS